jgi:co-chaperonin GroES (HSP10)
MMQEPPHEFDGIEARGSWIIAEQVALVGHTRGGLHVPEQSQLAVWHVLTVGKNTDVVVPGERIMFKQPSGGQCTVDGRTFVMLLPGDVIATLKDPPKDAKPLVVRGNGEHNGKIVVPS